MQSLDFDNTNFNVYTLAKSKFFYKIYYHLHKNYHAFNFLFLFKLYTLTKTNSFIFKMLTTCG